MVDDRESLIFERTALDRLFELLADEGYSILGPTVRDGAIAYGPIHSSLDLPQGVGVRQEAGSYRLTERDDPSLFGYAVGADSPKSFLYPPREHLCAFRRHESWNGNEVEEDGAPLAFVGVRPCELAAIAVMDRVLLSGPTPDVRYRQRRERCLLVVVNCTEPGGTCFCSSMGTGPEARAGFDIVLTEMTEPDRHTFLARAGTARGRELLIRWGGRSAQPAETAAVAARLERASGRMGRTLHTEGLAEALRASPEDPRWDEIASRCMNCANCTLACPTCFCCTVEDTTDLTGERAERHRRWDSCFTLGFSYIHGGSVRVSARSRYRQWLTHKLSTWQEQFGTQGCVGCGRCITWCPAGIDLTVEAPALAKAHAPAVSSSRER